MLGRNYDINVYLFHALKFLLYSTYFLTNIFLLYALQKFERLFITTNYVTKTVRKKRKGLGPGLLLHRMGLFYS